MDVSPREIYQCKDCGEPYSLRVDGGVIEFYGLWPDDFQDDVFSFKEQVLRICPNCEALVFKKDCKKLANVGGFEMCVEYPGVTPSTPPTYDKCLEMVGKLGSGLRLSKRCQLQLRRWLWWAGNHARRDDTPDLPLSESERDNQRAILDLLNPDKDRDLVTIVEIYRELGDFDAMRSYAARIKERGWKDFAAKIIALSETHGSTLARLGQ